MTIALVAHANAHGVNGGTTSGVNTTGANYARVAICLFQTSFSGTVSDSFGNTYIQAGTTIGLVNANIAYFYCASPTVGSGHTVTVSGSTIFAAVLFAAYSGVATSSPVESTFTSNTANSVTSITPGSLTPTSNGALLELIGAQNSNPTTVACGDVLYSVLDTVFGDNATTITGGAFYYVQTTATASNPAFQANASAANIAAALFAIDPASGGAVTGSAAWTEAQDIWAGVGAVAISGSAAWTEAKDIWSGTGGIVGTGTAAWTEAKDVWAGSGSVTTGPTGPVAWTEAKDIWAGTGGVLVSGSAAWTESKDIWSGTGSITLPGVSGSISWTESPDIWNGAGSLFGWTPVPPVTTIWTPATIGTSPWTSRS